MSEPDRDGPPRAVLIGAVLLAVGAAVAVLAIAAHRSSAPPVPVAAVRAPDADDPDCTTLLEALPTNSATTAGPAWRSPLRPALRPGAPAPGPSR